MWKCRPCAASGSMMRSLLASWCVTLLMMAIRCIGEFVRYLDALVPRSVGPNCTRTDLFARGKEIEARGCLHPVRRGLNHLVVGTKLPIPYWYEKPVTTSSLIDGLPSQCFHVGRSTLEDHDYLFETRCWLISTSPI